ncbi:hypothetical protein A2U01_0063603, partial [Trifolium medium]|nr:hypothetical protein [Trifolium medium]
MMATFPGAPCLPLWQPSQGCHDALARDGG